MSRGECLPDGRRLVLAPEVDDRLSCGALVVSGACCRGKGLYDLGKVRGDVILRPGAPGDGYAGIRKDEVHVGGRLALYDAEGPFGSPTSDSLRTSIDADSRDLLAVVMATGSYPRTAMAQHLERLADLYVRHCGAAPAWRGWLGPEGAA